MKTMIAGFNILMHILCISCSLAFFTSTTTTTKGSSTLSRVYSTTNSNTNSNEELKKQPHIVVLGGGFGGINTALTLPTLPWTDNNKSNMQQQPKITLIDKSERFVFLPLLYELCVDDASVNEVAPTFKSLIEENGVTYPGLIASLGSGLPDLSSALQLFTSRKQEEDNHTDDENNISFVQAQVEGIDVNTQQVVISKSSSSNNNKSIESIDYDALIIATGSEISLDAIPGASQYALPFYTVDQAFELKRRLKLLDTYLDATQQQSGSDDDEKKEQPPVNIVVVGGGYAGVELATNLVDRFGSDAAKEDGLVNVSLVHRGEQVLEYATEHNRKAGTDRLNEVGVNVMTSTSVVEVLPCEDNVYDGNDMMPVSLKNEQCILKVTTKSEDGADVEELLPTTLLLWTAGATPTSIQNKGIRNSILPRDAMGRILTSPTLNVPDYPNIFAIGDCSRPKKIPYPGTAQVAIQQATVAAYNAYAILNSDRSSRDSRSKLLPFKYLNLGEMMTLGSDDATISTLGGLVELSGPTASWLRRWIYAVRMPTPKQGVVAAIDSTGRKLARGAAGRRRRKSKPVDWK